MCPDLYDLRWAKVGRSPSRGRTVEWFADRNGEHSIALVLESELDKEFLKFLRRVGARTVVVADKAEILDL